MGQIEFGIAGNRDNWAYSWKLAKRNASRNNYVLYFSMILYAVKAYMQIARCDTRGFFISCTWVVEFYIRVKNNNVIFIRRTSTFEHSRIIK